MLLLLFELVEFYEGLFLLGVLLVVSSLIRLWAVRSVCLVFIMVFRLVLVATLGVIRGVILGFVIGSLGVLFVIGVSGFIEVSRVFDSLVIRFLFLFSLVGGLGVFTFLVRLFL